MRLTDGLSPAKTEKVGPRGGWPCPFHPPPPPPPRGGSCSLSPPDTAGHRGVIFDVAQGQRDIWCQRMWKTRFVGGSFERNQGPRGGREGGGQVSTTRFATGGARARGREESRAVLLERKTWTTPSDPVPYQPAPPHGGKTETKQTSSPSGATISGRLRRRKGRMGGLSGKPERRPHGAIGSGLGGGADRIGEKLVWAEGRHAPASGEAPIRGHRAKGGPRAPGGTAK